MEKSRGMDCHVPTDVLEYLARRVQSNVRDLEGNLNRVVAWSQFRETPISLDDVTKLVSDNSATSRGKAITDSAVITAVSEHFGIAPEQIRGKGRRKMTVLSRQVAMYLLREETDLSFTAIGKILGGRDHSTVLHGHGRVSYKIELDDSLRNDVLKIRRSMTRKL
jgi:chromosomal replication initiator protein